VNLGGKAEKRRTGMFMRSCSSVSLSMYAGVALAVVPDRMALRVCSFDSFRQFTCDRSKYSRRDT
jgi:hypothetical protein